MLAPLEARPRHHVLARIRSATPFTLALTLALFIAAMTPSGALAQTGLQFDGANDYVAFGQATSTLGTPTFTIETWFMRTASGTVTSTGTGANQANGLINVVPLLAKGRGQSDGTNVDCNYFLGIQNTPNVVLAADYEDFAASNNNHALVGTTVLRNDVWYHAAATYDGATFRLYLNGNLEASVATAAQPRFDSIQHASLGSALNSTPVAAGFFAGVIDEARVWDHARPQQGIRDSALIEVTSSPGLLGRWGLNDGSGTNAANSVGGSPDGTLSGTAPLATWVSGTPFAYAYGILLNGTSGYVTFGDPSALDLATFTVETWFRRDGAGTSTTTGLGGIPDAIPLVAHGAPEAEGSTVDMNFLLGLKSTGVLCADFEEGAGGASPGLNHPVVGTTVVTTGTWHHAAATYDGTTWNLYLDGSLEATLSVGQPVQSATTQHAALGTALTSAGVTNGFFNGVLDEARIWNSARSLAAIQATINSQLASPTEGLVSRWGMGEGGGRVVRDTSGSAAHGTLTPASPTAAWGWTSGAPFSITVVPPADPSDLTATATTHTRIELTWVDNATTETGYEIERSTTGSGGPFSPLASVAANAEAYDDIDLTPSTEYCYRVRATGSVPSGYTAAECAATPATSATALDFTGGATQAGFGDAATLRLSQFTIEMWLRRDGTGVGTDTGINGIPDAIPLVAKGRAEAEDPLKDINYFLGIKAASGVLCADFEEAAGGGTPSGNHPILGATPIAIGGWHHVAATYDGTTWALYLDGLLDAQLVVGQPAAAASNVAVSLARALNSIGEPLGSFEGAVDEVRIWNVARTAVEIQAAVNTQLTTPTTGLVARWALDEGTGTAVSGSAGTTVDGTITGAGYSWVPGAPFDIVPPTPPTDPTGLSALATSSSSIHLAWTDNATNETAYDVERSTTGSGGPFTLRATLSVDASSYDDSGLSGSTQYCYRVRARNGSAVSGYAGPECATTEAVVGSALDFAGATYVTFGDPAALDLAQFTVECWFRRDGVGTIVTTGLGGVPNAIPLVTKGTSQADGSNVDMNFFLGIDDDTDRLMADLEEGAGTTPGLNHPVIGSTTIADGVWHHAAATYDGTTWNLYLDGNLEATLAVGQPCQSQSIQPAALASSIRSDGTTAQGFLDGVIDEARIWNYARSQAQIQGTANAQITSAQSGLVARWGLDEGSGTAVGGSAGTTVSGTIVGVNSTWVPGAPFDLSLNLPPNAPTLNAPAHQATEIGLAPTLDVGVSDPDGGNLTVTWYGRALTGGPPGPDFTLIGQPDTQYYTGEVNGGTNAILLDINNWIVANRASRSIAYVATLGDCVEHGDNGGNDIEWQRADAAYDLIEDPQTTGLAEGIPYGITVGNHDQSPNGDPEGTTTFYNQYFGAARFQGRSYYGGHYGTDNDNWYDLFSAGGMDFIVISFEYDTTPDQAILDWADALLTTHSNRRAIVLSHNLCGVGNPATFSTQGSAVYNALRGHSNFFMMMAGHVPGEGRRQDSFNNVVVNTLMSDYQGRTNGGNGWIRIMTFSPANGTIEVETYSPWLDQFEIDADSRFTLTYDMTDTPSFQVLGSSSGVPSGSSPTLAWEGLAPGTEYEWYATVSDGSVTTTGPTWRFTTTSTVGVEGTPVTAVALAPVNPNPAHGQADLSFSLPGATPVRLSVLDIQGREVAVLASGVFGAGRHSVVWDGRTRGGTLSSGLYLVRLQTPGRTDVRKLIWAR